MFLAAGCREMPATERVESRRSVSTGPKVGIRPNGDTEIQPDLTKVSPELKRVYDYIDEHIDEHVDNLQKWIQQPRSRTREKALPNPLRCAAEHRVTALINVRLNH